MRCLSSWSDADIQEVGWAKIDFYESSQGLQVTCYLHTYFPENNFPHRAVNAFHQILSAGTSSASSHGTSMAILSVVGLKPVMREGEGWAMCQQYNTVKHFTAMETHRTLVANISEYTDRFDI